MLEDQLQTETLKVSKEEDECQKEFADIPSSGLDIVNLNVVKQQQEVVYSKHPLRTTPRQSHAGRKNLNAAGNQSDSNLQRIKRNIRTLRKMQSKNVRQMSLQPMTPPTGATRPESRYVVSSTKGLILQKQPTQEQLFLQDLIVKKQKLMGMKKPRPACSGPKASNEYLSKIIDKFNRNITVTDEYETVTHRANTTLEVLEPQVDGMIAASPITSRRFNRSPMVKSVLLGGIDNQDGVNESIFNQDQQNLSTANLLQLANKVGKHITVRQQVKMRQAAAAATTASQQRKQQTPTQDQPIVPQKQTNRKQAASALARNLKITPLHRSQSQPRQNPQMLNKPTPSQQQNQMKSILFTRVIGETAEPPQVAQPVTSQTIDSRQQTDSKEAVTSNRRVVDNPRRFRDFLKFQNQVQKPWQDYFDQQQEQQSEKFLTLPKDVDNRQSQKEKYQKSFRPETQAIRLTYMSQVAPTAKDGAVNGSLDNQSASLSSRNSQSASKFSACKLDNKFLSLSNTSQKQMTESEASSNNSQLRIQVKFKNNYYQNNFINGGILAEPVITEVRQKSNEQKRELDFLKSINTIKL